MKNQITSFSMLLAICIGILFTSCSTDPFDQIHENDHYQALAEYHQSLDNWISSDYTNLDGVDFDAILEDPELCPTIDESSTNFDGYDEIESFSKSIGFLNTSRLNDWFVSYGRVHYDLIKEYKPDDKKAFIDQVTFMHLENSVDECEMPIYLELANRAYAKANTYGVNLTGSGFRQCRGAALYGYNSSVYLIHKSINQINDCIRKP